MGIDKMKTGTEIFLTCLFAIGILAFVLGINYGVVALLQWALWHVGERTISLAPTWAVWIIYSLFIMPIVNHLNRSYNSNKQS